jgi:hypothetical protein
MEYDMSDQLFEVAFSGKISAGANMGEVKARVAKMFNADNAKLAQLFSGKRIVIKKNIDRATAVKYKTALNRAGAECEVKLIGGAPAAAPAATARPTQSAQPAKPAKSAQPAQPAQPARKAKRASAAPTVQIETSYDGEVAPPPQVDPLGISGDQIEDLKASIAPVGSELQNDYQEPEAPVFDLSGLDVAPVGSELNTAKKRPDPPPPDSSGISMAD